MIKFRVFDKANKCWAVDFTISLDGQLLCDNGSTLFIRDNFELMQWTALQDRNGKDIYAEDLIEYNDRIYLVPHVTPVSRHHDAECINGYKEICDDWTSWSNDCYEIIGNRFENPELLEEKNDYI